MKLKQITLLLVVSGIYTSVSAQSTVYKCVSSQGIVSYLNEPQSGYNCQKTELGSIKNMAMIKNEGGLPKSTSSTSSASYTSSDKIKDFNEKITKHETSNETELRRLVILNKELEDEKKQLDTMKKMMSNIADKNSQDFIRLKDIASSHQRNIDTLEGQIAKISPRETKILPLNIPLAEISKAIEEGEKIGNINKLPTNQLVVDREAIIPTLVAMKDNKIDYSKQLSSAKNAEEAFRMSNLALEEARRNLEEIEKRAKEAKEIFQKEKIEKDLLLAQESLKKQKEVNKLLNKEILKIEDELLVIMKRQNLLLEERNFLWKKQQQLEEKVIAKIDDLKEKNALRKIEEDRKQIQLASLKENKMNLLKKNKDLAEQKMKILLEKKKLIEAQNLDLKLKKDEINKDFKKMV